jgi:class 3 adenylate cyclase
MSVSVVCANLRGLHAAHFAGCSADAVAGEIGAAVAALEAAATARQGILTFHGDRMLATFNAARGCASHATKAAAAAVAAVAALDASPGPLRLRLTAGVATGTCLVGSVGSAGVKSLSVVGPAVSDAALLERLTRVHEGASVLATQRVCFELATTSACAVRFVDLVALRTAAGVRAVAVGSLAPRPAKAVAGSAPAAAGGGDSEWMYFLQERSAEAGAPYNRCFERLQQGDVPGAVEAYLETLARCERLAASAGSDAHPAPDAKLLVAPPRLVAMMDALKAGSSPCRAPVSLCRDLGP